MFLALNDRVNVAFFRLMVHLANTVATTQHVTVFGVPIWTTLGLIRATSAIAPNCTDNVVGAIQTGVSAIVKVLMGAGVSIAVIGIIIGGLMRATSFGNERRIAMSNTAITCSVVGLVIVLIGATVGNQVPTWFGFTVSGNCQVS